MFKNYQVVIFKDQHGTCRKLRLRGWLFALIFLALIAVVAGDLTLIKYYYNYKRMELDLTASEKTSQEQNTQLHNLSDKMQGLEADLSRIRTFDTKLRRMINLSREPQEVAPSGSDDKDENAKYLPLYRQELLTRKLHHYLDTLRDQASLELVRQEELLRVLGASAPRLASLPTDWPVAGWVSSSFGERTSPFTGKKEFHKGMDPGDAKHRIQGVETREPAFNLPALWVPALHKDEAVLAGYTVVDPSTVIATHLTEVFKRHLPEFLGRQEVQTLLDNLAKRAPKAVEDLVPGAMRRIIKNILRQLGFNNIVEADDGSTAWETLGKDKIDFVISDWNMTTGRSSSCWCWREPRPACPG